MRSRKEFGRMALLLAGVFAVALGAGDALAGKAKKKDYLRDRWDPIHFRPNIDRATNEQCLACHKEILTRKPRKVSLKCNFCHRGNDPREEAPGSHAENVKDAGYTLRKMVDPEKTCLRCHGKFPFEFMEGLEDDWSKIRQDFEDEETKNGCLAACHGETFRTVRHQVTYLKPKNIEKLAKMKDVVPETPEWAKNRPTQSEARYRRKK